MIDPHIRFSNWLTAGANGEPPRDAALHASVCAECAASVAAHDALAGIDPGAAPIPPSRLVVEDPAGFGRTGAFGAGLGGLAVAAIAGFLALGQLTAPSPAGVTDSPTPAEAVLGGLVSPEPSATATVRPSRSPTPSPSPTPTAEDDAGGEAAPTTAAEPAPGAAAAPPPPPPPPSAGSTPPPNTPTPVVTATPTPSPPPSANPTPDPTPSPSPNPTPAPQCSDGVDNDGDELIDFGLDPLVNDPDCLSPDDDEAGLLP